MCLHDLIRLVTSEYTRFDNMNSETKAQVMLRKYPDQNFNFSKRHVVKTIVILSMSKQEGLLFTERQSQTTKKKFPKMHCKTTRGVASQIWVLAGIKTMFAFLVKQFTVKEMKLTECKIWMALKTFSQCHYTADFWRSKHCTTIQMNTLVQGCQTYGPRAKTGPLRGWVRPAGWVFKVKTSLFAWEVYPVILR